MAEETTKKKYLPWHGTAKFLAARVRMCEGTGSIRVNGRELDDFFTEDKDRRAVGRSAGSHRDA